MWVQWDNDLGRMLGMIRHLPQSLEGRDSAQLAQLGYREVVTREPDNMVARFPSLRGSAEFELLPDGRVLQTFPEADYSVAAVRRELTAMMKDEAKRELLQTDWYFVRKVELGTDVPEDVLTLRQKIRTHVEWLEGQIAELSARELIDYRWLWPKTADQEMVYGVPTRIQASPPPPVVPTPEPPPPPGIITGEAQGVFGNADPNVVDPAPTPPAPPEELAPPVTTDGPVPVFKEGEEPRYLDANGFPLITVYAPNVEDTGPRPDQQ